VANQNVEVVRCYHERSEHPRSGCAHTYLDSDSQPIVAPRRPAPSPRLRRPRRRVVRQGPARVEQGLPEAAGASQVVCGELDQVERRGGRRYGFASRTRSSGREVAPSPIQCLSRQMLGRSTPRAPTRVLVAGVQRFVPNMLGAAWRAISGSRWSAGPPTRGWVKGHRVDELPGESPALWAAGSAHGVVSGASAAASPWRRSSGSKTVVVHLA
jgi:hypothetical protein